MIKSINLSLTGALVLLSIGSAEATTAGYGYYCPTDYTFFKLTCFKVVNNESQTYYEADEICKSEGGFLASLHSEAEKSFIFSLVEKKERYWIGGFFDREGGVFRWEDGTQLEYQDWTAGTEKRGCGAIDQRKRMTTATCTQQLSYVCKRVQDPLKIPELNEDGCPAEYIVNGEMCYRLESKQRETYFDAKSKCHAEGGFLVNVNTETLQSYVSSELVKTTVSTYWIGLRYNNEDQFMWNDGSNYTYTNWFHREPTLPTAAERCAWAVSGVNHQWMMSKCDYKSFYACNTPIRDPIALSKARLTTTTTSTTTEEPLLAPTVPADIKVDLNGTFINGTAFALPDEANDEPLNMADIEEYQRERMVNEASLSCPKPFSIFFFASIFLNIFIYFK